MLLALRFVGQAPLWLETSASNTPGVSKCASTVQLPLGARLFYASCSWQLHRASTGCQFVLCPQPIAKVSSKPCRQGLTPRSTPDPLRQASQAGCAAASPPSHTRLAPPAYAGGVNSNVRPRRTQRSTSWERVTNCLLLRCAASFHRKHAPQSRVGTVF